MSMLKQVIPRTLPTVLLPLAIALSPTGQAGAQIIPDATLPNPSVVQRGDRTTQITGGTEAGGNLFHSFQEFSVEAERTASFQQLTPTLERIITRITGNTPSQIDGTIEALQDDGTVSGADLFLLNPNGIIFGPDAALNIGGSFVATTGDRLLFADGMEFRADGTQSSPLLTVSVPVGIQMGQNPGAIVNESFAPLVDATGNPIMDETGSPIDGGLQVRSGRTLALVGGAIALPGGVITANAGRIELGSIGANERVGLRTIPSGWAVEYDTVSAFEDIDLAFAVLDASGTGGGSIQLRGDRIALDDETLILSDTLGGMDGDGIDIRASDLIMDNLSLMSAVTEGTGRGGDITIQLRNLTLQNGSQISTSTFLTEGTGHGGDITIQLRNLTLQNGSQISTSTFGSGDAGTIRVTASDVVRMEGWELGFDGQVFSSGLFSQVESRNATGSGGTLRLESDRLEILGGAQVSTSTGGRGDAGALRVNANTVIVDGSALNARGDLLRVNLDGFITLGGLPRPSGLFTNTLPGSTGAGNDLVIRGDRLSLSNGAVIRTGTLGAGPSGDLTIQASERIEVRGTDQDGFSPTSIFAASGGIPNFGGVQFRDATGQGGTIRLRTPELRVEDGGAIAVGSLNPESAAQGAGTLNITADRLFLDEGNILAETASGAGGDIRLRINEALLLRRGSLVSTTAGVENAGGDGGNISITSRFIVAGLTENNDIRANAFTGRGGTIRIQTEGITGIAPRDTPSPLSDITASSERGVDGTVRIDVVESNPDRGTVELPADVVDAARLVAQGCGGAGAIAAEQQGEFFVRGRGGVSPSPTTPLSGSAVVDDLRLPTWMAPSSIAAMRSDQASGAIATHEPEIDNTLPIHEADGWTTNNQGELVLVARREMRCGG